VAIGPSKLAVVIRILSLGRSVPYLRKADNAS
jgi:hypothetical protein